MRKIIVLLLLIIGWAECFAQVRPARKREYERFRESTTYVVRDRDPFSQFNEHIEAALKKFWTITPVEFISYEEFEKLRTRQDASFLVFADIKQKNLPHVYEFINFVMGDPKRDFESMPDLGSVPLCYRDVDSDSYMYKMGVFVKFMQTMAREGESTPSLRLTRLVNANNPRLKEMELWLLKEELASEIDSEEKIAKYYPHKVRLVSKDDIATAINQAREDVAILHKIGPEDTIKRPAGQKCWKFIVAVKDGSVLYSHDHEISRAMPDALLSSDLQRIAR